MRTFSADQQTIRDMSEKETYWFLDISYNGTTDYLSTVTMDYDGHSYLPKIDVETFDGVTLNRNRCELNGIAPTEFEFDIMNEDDTYTASDFVDAEVIMKFVQGGRFTDAEMEWDGMDWDGIDWEGSSSKYETMFSVKFIISDARDILGRIHCKCDDLIQSKLRGFFPNDKFARNIFPSMDMRFGRSKEAGLSDLVSPWIIGTGYPPLPYVYVQNVISLTTTVDFIATSDGSRCQITRDSGDSFSTLEIGREITITNAADAGNNQTIRLLYKPDNDTMEFDADDGIVADTNDEITIKQDLGLYLMGSTTPTYTVTEVKSPYNFGKASTWGSGSYTFSQLTAVDADSNNWKALRPLIMDSDNDGTADSTGLFVDGGMILPMPTEITRSDLSAKTDPTDAIEMFLEAIGVASADIDSTTQASVKSTYTDETDLSGETWIDSPATPGEWYKSGAEGEPTYLRHDNAFLTKGTLGSLANGEWDYGDQDTLGYDTIYYKWASGDPNSEEIATNCGISLNGSLFTRWGRSEALSMLMNCGNIILDPEDEIKFRFRIKTSQKTIDDSYVITSGEADDDSTFEYSPTYEEYSDSAEAEWFGYATEEIPAISTVTVEGNNNKLSGEFLNLKFLNNYKNVRRAGRIELQRKYGKKAEVSFLGKSKLIDVQPDDVITINENDYGGNYACLVDKMHITPDGLIEFAGFVYSHSLDDWADLNPASITYLDDDGTYKWEPVYAGPQSDQDVGQTSFEVWGLPYLVVGPNIGAAPYTDIKTAINDLYDSQHAGIFLLNGDYSLSDKIYYLDRNIDIIGESQGGVVVKNNDGDDGFYLYNLSKVFQFINFTIDSENTSTYTKMIHVLGSAAVNNTATVKINGVKFLLNNDGTKGRLGDGDSAIYIDKSTGRITTTFCYSQNGLKNYHYNDCETIIHTKNESFGSTFIDLDLDTVTDFILSQNIINNFYAVGIKIWDDCFRGEVSKNIVTSATSGMGADLLGTHGIFVTASSLSEFLDITSNQIKIHTSSGNLTYYGLSCAKVNKGIISLNSIDIDVTSTAETDAMEMRGVDDSVIEGNIVYLDNDDITSNHYGLQFVVYGDRNVISGNNINLINNDAKDIGIDLGAGCDNNQGGDNITYNVGSSITDAGAGNAVTAKDV